MTRCSARVLLGCGAWVLSGYRAKVLPGCGIVMLPHCRARELFGRGIVMRPRVRRCETRAVPRVWALARVSCRVIAFS